MHVARPAVTAVLMKAPSRAAEVIVSVVAFYRCRADWVIEMGACTRREVVLEMVLCHRGILDAGP